MSRKIVKNSSFTFIGEICYKIFYFFVIAYLGKIFSISDFGKINFASSLILFLMVFVSGGGIDTIAVRDIARKVKQDRYVGGICVLKIFVALVIYLAVLIFVYLIDMHIVVKNLILMEGIMFFVMAFYINWFFQGYQQMHWVSLSKLMQGIILLVLVFFYVSKGSNILLFSLYKIITGAAGSLFLIYIFIKKFGAFKIHNVKKDFLKKKITASLPITFGTLMIALNNYADKIILGSLISQKAVGLYSSAYCFFAVLSIIPLAITTGFFPALSLEHAKENNISRVIYLLEKMVKILLILGVAFAMLAVVFAKTVLIATFGSKYNESVGVLTVLLLGIPIVFLAAAYTTSLLAFGKNKKWFVTVVIGGLTNVILNLIFIPLYGIYGAAIAILSTNAVIWIVARCFVIQMAKIPIFVFSIKLVTSAACLGWGINFLFNNVSSIFFIAVISFVTFFVYILILFFLGCITKKDFDFFKKYADEMTILDK